MQRVAFIFDMDGVIVDSNPFHKIALKQFCKKYGKEFTEEELKEKIFGRTNRDWLKNVFGELEEKQLQAYAQEKEQLFRDLYQHDIRLLPGLDSFLKRMDELKIVRVIGTSAPRENVDFTLSKTGTKTYFPTILDDSFVVKGKPDPQIYLRCAEAVGFDPANCIVFEDSLSGVEAGKKAGCRVVGVSTTHSKEELAQTDYVINDFTNLKPEALVARLFDE